MLTSLPDIAVIGLLRNVIQDMGHPKLSLVQNKIKSNSWNCNVFLYNHIKTATHSLPSHLWAEYCCFWKSPIANVSSENILHSFWLHALCTSVRIRSTFLRQIQSLVMIYSDHHWSDNRHICFFMMPPDTDVCRLKRFYAHGIVGFICS